MNRSGSRCVVECILALVLVFLAVRLSPRSQTAAAEEPRPAPPSFIERATSELVLIEAHVTDPKGRQVRGLVREDFVLKVDGKVKPVASFEFKSLDDLPRLPGAGQRADASPAPGTVVVVPRRFALFFEDALSSAPGLTAARHAADDLLRSGLEPSDQVALFSFDKRLRMLHGFTADRDTLRAALHASLQDTARVKPWVDRSQLDETILDALTVPSGGETGKVHTALFLAQSAASIEQARTHAVFNALRGVADSLSPWPGYKAIVLMSDGFSENPASESFLRIDDGSLPPSVTRLVRQLGTETQDSVRLGDLRLNIKDFVQDMTASSVTVHTIQTSGLVDAAPGASRAASLRGDPLKALASNTGGVTWALNDPLKGLKMAEDSARAYYVLGYAPEGERDGRFHAVTVELTRRAAKDGARVTARRGFVLLKPAEAYSRTIQAAYTIPEMFHGVRFDLCVVLGPPAGSNRTVDAVLHVPEGEVLYLARGGQATARLEVGLVATGTGDTETFRLSRSLSLAAVGARTEARGGLNLFARFPLPRSVQTLTAVVSDRSSGATGGARAVVPACADPAPKVAGLSLYSPQESSLWVDLHEPDGTQRQKTRGPALKSVFQIGETIVAGFRTEGSSDGAGSMLVEIRRGDSLIRTLRPDAGASGAGEGLVRLTLPVDGFEPGDYVIAVRDRAKKADIQATLDFHLLPKN